MNEPIKLSTGVSDTEREFLDQILEKHRLDEIDFLSLDKALWLNSASSTVVAPSSFIGPPVPANSNVDPSKIYGPIDPNNITGGSAGQNRKGSNTNNKYKDLIIKAANAFNLDPILFEALIWAESDFNPKCRSGVGAMGLAQLMPPTAKMLGVKNPWDPEQNLMGGAKYLAMQFKTFDGNVSLALAAYNAGPGNVRKYKGIPPFTETRNYVKKILKKYQEYKNGK